MIRTQPLSLLKLFLLYIYCYQNHFFTAALTDTKVFLSKNYEARVDKIMVDASLKVTFINICELGKTALQGVSHGNEQSKFIS